MGKSAEQPTTVRWAGWGDRYYVVWHNQKGHFKSYFALAPEAMAFARKIAKQKTLKHVLVIDDKLGEILFKREKRR